MCFFICSVLVYYLRSKSKARIEMVKLLKEMLYIEAKDKEFLLANITRVTQNNGKQQHLTSQCCFFENKIFFLPNTEWLFDDCVKQTPPRTPRFNRSNRKLDKYTNRMFGNDVNGKFTEIDFNENKNTIRYKSTPNITRNSRSTNGNADLTKL